MTMEEKILEQMKKINETQKRSFVTLTETGQIDAEIASELKDMFEDWKPDMAYKVGHIRKYNDVLYRVVQEHTSQADWLPSSTPSLYEPIIISEEGYLAWSKPSGSHDAYNIGDIVDYNGTLYKSLIDGNVYSPDEYPAGWELFDA